MIPTLLRRMLNLRRSVFIEILRTAQDFSRCHLVATVENNSLGEKKKKPNKTCRHTVGLLLADIRLSVLSTPVSPQSVIFWLSVGLGSCGQTFSKWI